MDDRNLRRRKAGCNSNYFGVNDNYMLLNGAMSSPTTTPTTTATTGGKGSKTRKGAKKGSKTRKGVRKHGGNPLDSALNTAFAPLADLGRNGGGEFDRRDDRLRRLRRGGEFDRRDDRLRRLRRGGNFVSDLINATSANAMEAPPSAPPSAPQVVATNQPQPPAPQVVDAKQGGGLCRARKMAKGGTMDLAPFLTSIALFTARAINDEELMKQLKMDKLMSFGSKTGKSSKKSGTTKKSKASTRKASTKKTTSKKVLY
jgi:hypothetical protein